MIEIGHSVLTVKFEFLHYRTLWAIIVNGYFCRTESGNNQLRFSDLSNAISYAKNKGLIPKDIDEQQIIESQKITIERN